MSVFTTSFSQRLANLGRKLKAVWLYILAGLIIIGGAIVGIILVNNEDDNKTDETARPEVAQIFEPSIGTPLPPDTSTESGQVEGGTTTEPSTTTETTTQPEVMFQAPATGVDDSKPFIYSDLKSGYKVNLAGGTQVTEANEGAEFYTIGGQVLFYVVVVDQAQSPETTIAQLKNSSGVSSISQQSFANLPAVSFKQNNQSGLAIHSKKTYYLIGNSTYFKNFSLN